MTTRVDEALRSIPDMRARVDAADDYLREVIRRVETVLGALRPIEIDVPYAVKNVSRRIMLRQSRDGRWYVAWSWWPSGEGSAVALLSAPREIRLEAFTAIAWLDHATSLAPVEALIVAVNRELSMEVDSRGPQMDVARRVEAMIDVAAGRLRGQDRSRADPR